MNNTPLTSRRSFYDPLARLAPLPPDRGSACCWRPPYFLPEKGSRQLSPGDCRQIALPLPLPLTCPSRRDRPAAAARHTTAPTMAARRWPR